MSAFRDETTLLWLTVVGAAVYVASVLLLFGSGWLPSQVRGWQGLRPLAIRCNMTGYIGARDGDTMERVWIAFDRHQRLYLL